MRRIGAQDRHIANTRRRTPDHGSIGTCAGNGLWLELRRLVSGLSEKMLIQQLRELQAEGVIERVDFKEVPPKVEYLVTPLGRTLAQAPMPLCEGEVCIRPPSKRSGSAAPRPPGVEPETFTASSGN